MSRFTALLPLSAAASCLTALSLATAAQAQVVYSNDFETNTAGFTSASTELLPTDSQGFGVSPNSTYLSRFSNGTVSLALTGLEIGTTYTVEMDLFTGATWDGGGDVFQLQLDGGPFLINSSFGNFGSQTYSDTTPVSGPGSTFAPLTGADFFNLNPGNNTFRYGIYLFSKGAGNPTLQFTATATTAQLNFIGTGLQDSSDEYWAVDNVVVRGPGVVAVPEGGTLGLLAAGSMFGIGAVVARRRSKR